MNASMRANKNYKILSNLILFKTDLLEIYDVLIQFPSN